MVNDYMGIIIANENEDNLKNLTQNRPLASIPIGGRYRIIDFILSNMVNSGINNVGIFTQSKSRSLVDHLGSGKSWDLDRKINGLFVFNFGICTSYLASIEMLKNNMEYLYQSKENNVVVAPSYMLYNINFEEVIKYHEASNKAVTVLYKKVDNGTKAFINCDVLNIDKNNTILSVGKNIGIDDNNNISMETFIMRKEFLINLIYYCIKTGCYSNIKDAIYKYAQDYKLCAYEFNGYLQCINSISSYYKTNMDMLNQKVTSELFYKNGYIYTKVKDESPTKYSNQSSVSNSLIANGCIIEGSVENSIIFRRVKIHKGAEVVNSIIMQNCEIKQGVKLSNIIIDKNVIIECNKELKGDKEFPLVIEKKAII